MIKKDNKAEMDKELEQKLWKACDVLRGNISSEQYMYIIIGILFLKYMSDKYDDAYAKLVEDENNIKENINAILEQKEEFKAVYNCSTIVPEKASWKYISQFASTKEIGKVIDLAFESIENTNDELRGLFDKDYNREELDQIKLGQVVSEFSNIDVHKYGEDIVGRIYEYFLGNFFQKQGQKGGEFYTPQSVVETLVSLVKPSLGSIFDPACGTGGMFIQTKKYLEEHDIRWDDMIIYGQEFQNKTWKLAKINLLLNNLSSQNIHLGTKSADSFTEDQFSNEKFDYVLANPPFNLKNWGKQTLADDPRWAWGLPPENNANYAWLSHMLFHAKTNEENKGRVGSVLANGSLSGSNKAELEFRKRILEENKVEAIVTLPDKLFYNTGIPACLWILSNSKTRKEVLFINASNLEGEMLSKKLRKLTESDIQKIASVHDEFLNGANINELGFAKSVEIQEIIDNDYSFVPGRYVGVVEEVINQEEVKAEIKTLAIELETLLDEFNDLVPKVKESIKQALKYELENEKNKNK